MSLMETSEWMGCWLSPVLSSIACDSYKCLGPADSASISIDQPPLVLITVSHVIRLSLSQSVQSSDSISESIMCAKYASGSEWSETLPVWTVVPAGCSNCIPDKSWALQMSCMGTLVAVIALQIDNIHGYLNYQSAFQLGR